MKLSPFVVKPCFGVKGEIDFLGDKSIAHRGVIFSALAPFKTTIENFPLNQDCLSTVNIFKSLGIKITCKPIKDNPDCAVLTVFGQGLNGLRQPDRPVFAGDSGTTLRLILGVLAGQNFKVRLLAGKSLSNRPMLRVTKPLRMMGAVIKAKVKSKKGQAEEYPPIEISGGNLKAISYRLPVASAQVKSAVLLAGLFAKGTTRIIEPLRTRDHTENMLRLFKADIKTRPGVIKLRGGKELISPGRIVIPGDISSAGFFMVMAAISRNSCLRLKDLCLNPTRAGIIKVLKRMGADIKISRSKLGLSRFEPVGDVTVKSSNLKGAVIRKAQMPSLIDELPVLMVAACFARGRTVFEGIGELRVKETDRVKSMYTNLKRMGADILISGVGGKEIIIIRGTEKLRGSSVKSFGDHRTAMSMVIAGLASCGNTKIDDINCIKKSFPNFLNTLNELVIY